MLSDMVLYRTLALAMSSPLFPGTLLILSECSIEWEPSFTTFAVFVFSCC